jgi:DNA-binding transcriptional ArsR family regulator
MDTPLTKLSDCLKALAHPVRLRIVHMLRDGELCVCQVTAVLQLATSTVSAHLALLRRAGLLRERKHGRWVGYSLPPAADPASQLLVPLWTPLADDPQLRADEALVRELRRVPAEDLCQVNLDLEKLGIARTDLTQGASAP